MFAGVHLKDARNLTVMDDRSLIPQDSTATGNGHHSLYRLALSRRRLFPHGGARRSASRQSTALSLRQCEQVIRAALRARVIGLPLNRMMTVHLAQAGVADSEAAKAVGRFLKLIRDWVARWANAAAVWVRESGVTKGTHVHILLHVPDGLSLRGRTKRWVFIAFGSRRARIVRTRKLPSGLAYIANLDTVLAYLLKGASPHAATVLGLTYTEPGGVIIGKRCGGSQNIWAARRAGSPNCDGTG